MNVSKSEEVARDATDQHSSESKADQAPKETSPDQEASKSGESLSESSSDPMGDVERAAELPPDGTTLDASASDAIPGPASVPQPSQSIPSRRQLSFSSIDEAKEYDPRTQLKHVPDDDVSSVRAAARGWVTTMLDAMDQELKSVPTLIPASFDGDAQEIWDKWQATAQGNVEEFSVKGKDKAIERMTWILVDQAIAMHEEGYQDSETKVKQDIKCSQRLQLMTDAIGDFAPVRWNILTNNTGGLAANPERFWKRKVTNLWGNEGRKRSKASSAAATSKRQDVAGEHDDGEGGEHDIEEF